MKHYDTGLIQYEARLMKYNEASLRLDKYIMRLVEGRKKKYEADKHSDRLEYYSLRLN